MVDLPCTSDTYVSVIVYRLYILFFVLPCSSFLDCILQGWWLIYFSSVHDDDSSIADQTAVLTPSLLPPAYGSWSLLDDFLSSSHCPFHLWGCTDKDTNSYLWCELWGLLSLSWLQPSGFSEPTLSLVVYLSSAVSLLRVFVIGPRIAEASTNEMGTVKLVVKGYRGLLTVCCMHCKAPVHLVSFSGFRQWLLFILGVILTWVQTVNLWSGLYWILLLSCSLPSGFLFSLFLGVYFAPVAPYIEVRFLPLRLCLLAQTVVHFMLVTSLCLLLCNALISPLWIRCNSFRSLLYSLYL